MQIKELGVPAPHNNPEDAARTQGHSTSNTDIGFFTSLLERSALPVNRADTTQRPTLLAEAGQHVKDLESRLAHALKSTGADPDDFKQYPRELSNVVLTSQLLVKSLGKATQCIDKISNLQ
jgi:hypothetical protein